MLKAGFVRVDITPPLGSFIPGYFEKRYSKGMLDPIELNVLALSDGEETVVMAISDLLGIREAYATPIREKIAERTGVPADHVMVTALHQHTSACLRQRSDESEAANVVDDAAYMSVLYRKFCDAAQMACDDMSEATWGIAAQEVEHKIAFIRRYMMKDGTIKTNPGIKRQAEIDHPMGEADNTVRLVRFNREGKNDIALVGFSTHPDTVSGEKYSADWPGFVRRYVEADLEGVSCVLLNGCQGDSNHLDFIGWSKAPSNSAERYAHTAFMGRTIADTVLKIWDKTKEQKNDKVDAGVTTVFNKTRTDGEEFYDECLEVYEDCAIKGNKVHPTKSGIPHYTAYRIVRMRNAPLFQKIPVTVVALGDMAFVGFGGEPFTHYATAVRENFPGKFIMAACCANGYEGYLPTRSAFEEGGYEAGSSPFQPTLEEDCVAAATELLKKMNG